MAGEPTVSQVGFWGDSWGYDTGDGFVLFVVAVVTCATVGLERRERLRDLLVFPSGTATVLWVGSTLYAYWSDDGLLLRPGIGLVVGSGLLLATVSVAAFSKRAVSRA